MAISNLSNQHISASFQYLTQISASGNIYDGFGNQIAITQLRTEDMENPYWDFELNIFYNKDV